MDLLKCFRTIGRSQTTVLKMAVHMTAVHMRVVHMLVVDKGVRPPGERASINSNREAELLSYCEGKLARFKLPRGAAFIEVS
jgi:hypothetical protein